MSKNNSSVELIGTDKKRIKEYTMKTASYPDLPILHNYKKTNTCLMEFPKGYNGFDVPFTLKVTPDKLKFEAIVSELYNFLNVADLKMMKINKRNYLEVKQSSFLAVCSFCYNDITSTSDLKKCGTVDCFFRSCSRLEYYHVLENKDYYNNCFTVNQSINNDTSDRIFIESNNGDCVTVFGDNVVDVDDDIQSVANTLKRMSDISLFAQLPDCVVDDSCWLVPLPEQLDSVVRKDVIEENETRPVDCLLLPTETDDNNDNKESDTSQISDDGDDGSQIIPVDEFVKPYLMKGGNCIHRNSINKTFYFNQEFYTRDALESMHEKWKSEVMISFTVYSKIKMNGFMDWNLWIKNLLNYEVVTKYKQLVIDDDRNRKTELFDSLYIDKFKKLNIKHLFMLKSPNTFVIPSFHYTRLLLVFMH